MVIVQHVCSVALFVCCFAGIYQDRVSPVGVVGLSSLLTVVGWIMWDHWIGQDEATAVAAAAAADAATTAARSDMSFFPGPSINDASLTKKPDEGSPGSSEPAYQRRVVHGRGSGHSPPKPTLHGLGVSISVSNLGRPAHQRTPSSVSHHSHSVSATSFQSISSMNSLQNSSSEALSRERSSPAPLLHPKLTSNGHASSIPSVTGSTLPSFLPPRVQSRLRTIKSTVLIYLTLLGLSPILMSLTHSTSSDSIWALATWLLIINIFFFDYGGLKTPAKAYASAARDPLPPPPLQAEKETTTTSSGISRHSVSPAIKQRQQEQTPHTSDPAQHHSSPPPAVPSSPPSHQAISTSAPPFPSSLSTNAALMASTVLASRLPSITHVFSLTVFSIEVFGLFPVFCRHLRHVWPTGHTALTFVLVTASSAGLSVILSASYSHNHPQQHTRDLTNQSSLLSTICWPWIWHLIRRSVLGITIGWIGTAFAMGGCSWWLISLQRYKNVVTGPWDPARPILAGGQHLGRGRGLSG